MRNPLTTKKTSTMEANDANGRKLACTRITMIIDSPRRPSRGAA